MTHNNRLESSGANKKTYNEDVARSLVSGLNALRKSGTLCDVTLRVGERAIRAHKIVICASSPYFMAMFTGRFLESKQEKITIREINAECLELLIDFMYTGKLNIDSANVDDVLLTASFLQITSAEELCQRFMQNELDVFDCIDNFTTENLLLGLNELRKSGTFCDVTVRVGERAINVHKIVASISSHFKSLFPGNFRELNQQEISIKNVDADCLELLIEYMYTGMLGINSTNVKDVLLSAHLLKIVSAEKLCYKVMGYKLNRRTFIEYVLFARKHSIKPLMDILLEKAFDVFPKIFSGNDHSELNVEEMKQLTQRLVESGHPEDLIYSFVMRWINSSDDTRVDFMKELLDLLNPSLISPGMMHSSEFANTSHPAFAAWEARGNAACLPNESDDRILFIATGFGFNPLIIKPFVQDEDPQSIFLPRKLRYGGYVCYGYNIYHQGGWRKERKPLSESYVYHPTKRMWAPFVPLQEARYAHGSCVLFGRIYSVVGTNGNESLSSVEYTDLCTGQRGFINPLPRAKMLAAVGLHENSMYVMGGAVHASARHYFCIHRFDPREGTWQELAPSPYAAGARSCAVIGESIYTTHHIYAMQRYDIRANDWERIPMEDNECAAEVFAVDNTLFGLFYNGIARFIFEDVKWVIERKFTGRGPFLQVATNLLLPNVAGEDLTNVDDFVLPYSLEISGDEHETDSNDAGVD